MWSRGPRISHYSSKRTSKFTRNLQNIHTLGQNLEFLRPRHRCTNALAVKAQILGEGLAEEELKVFPQEEAHRKGVLSGARASKGPNQNMLLHFSKRIVIFFGRA